MNDAWFDANVAGGLIGSGLGLAGSLMGVLGGVFAPRGRRKSLVFGLHYASMVVCGALAIAGGVAFARGQPRDVVYVLGYPGLLGLVIFGVLTPVLIRRYRDAELRKSFAQDL